ncbi:tetratricopeptide repeat protein [Candidatus Dependentiae bacterium]
MGKRRKRRKEKQANQEIKKTANIKAWQPDKAPFWQYLIPPAIISVLTVLFYAPSMRYAFQFDDIANIKKFFHIRHYSIKNLWFSGTRWISYWLNTIHYSISKFSPISYRIGNLIIHLANGVLVFFIIFTALRHLKHKNFFSRNYFAIAFLTSILFLLHPVQTQTVSYVIQGQLEGLAALSILSMTFLFLKSSYANSIAKRRLFIFLLFVVAALSCGTKEIAIISPAIIILVDWFLVAQGDWQSFKSRLYIHIPLAILVVGLYMYFLKPTFFTEILGLKRLAKNNIGNVITQNPNDKITPWAFLISQFKVIIHYLWIFIYPLSISVEYDWVLSKSFFALDCILPLAGLLLIGLFILKILIKNRSSMVAFGALWFFVSISPRSSIIPSPELLVDYKTYTASFGWLFLISCTLVYAYQYLREKATFLPRPFKNIQNCTAIASILIGMLAGYLTMQRNTIWRSGMEFWGDMIKHAPGKARAYNNYGVEMSQNLKDFKGSIPYFKKAISMDSKYPDPWNNLAVAYANINELDDAIHALKQSIRIYPYYPENYNNLASFYIQKNELDQAEKLLKTAIRLRAHYGKAHFNMGRILFARQEKKKAWQYFKKACTECDFDDVPHGFAIYGKVSMMLQKYDDAIFAYQKTLSLDPGYQEAAFGLANAYYMAKKYNNAISIYTQLTQRNPNDFKSWYNMGETYVSLEKYEQALNCYKKAKRMKWQFPQLQIRLASCLQKLGRTQEAKQTLEQVICAENKNSKNNVAIAQAQAQARTMLAKLNGKPSVSA